jgi:hypothetical protein
MRQAMEAEYDRQVLGVGYVWPAYADDPGKFKPKGALNAWVLDFNFANDKGDQVRDSSGRNNHGKALSALLVSDPDGKPARQFSGKSSIDVQKSPTLNPAVEDWTVEVTFKPQGPDGVLLAHGGASYGYCVALQDGKPLLAVVGGKVLTILRANTTISGDWTTIRARLNSREAVLETDGKEVARNTLKAPLDREPVDRLQIGADLGSQVLPHPPPGFTGLIRSVRIYSGVAPVSK